MPTRPPNILLINCDDLGYGDLSCYGSPVNRTPHIDQLAAGGLRLTDFYMASPVCSASRAAMLTGCYPSRIGFDQRPVLHPGSDLGLSPDETTIATALREVGYASKIIGKWHCGDQPEFLPTRHGFDDYFGIPFSNDMGRQANRPDHPPLPLLRGESVIQEQPDQRGLTERYTDEAVRFLRDHHEQPFFLYLAHMYVHVPLFVPRQFLDRSQNGAYGGAVECIDWSTGVLVDELKKLGLLDNTLIIFTSDNGSRARDEGGRNAPCRGTKATTWEGGQRVPCIVHWPDAIAPGQVNPSLAASIDLFPTLVAAAGANPGPLPIDGIDLGPLLRSESQESGRDTFFYFAGSALEAVRVGDWKLHLHKDGLGGQGESLRALYNLRDDVGESHNRADDHPNIVADLEARMETMRQQLGDRLTNTAGSECRPIGRVDSARPLTQYREDHPYMIAMYDLPDMPTMNG